jgi:NAD(P) transhydrogenase subunit alpha
MKISTIKEKNKSENRVSITPESARLLKSAGFDVNVEKASGLKSNFRDEEYESYSKLSSVPLEILSDADIITKVQPSDKNDEFSEANFAKKGSVIIGFFNPHNNKELIEFYASKKITLLSMEQVPRTTKAQSFDALSSQANLVGYRSVIEASYLFMRAFPMLMTAAGTINPAKVLVIGAGVAGLQAIATAKRLGASVFAYDVRAAAKEQVESLGAKFIHPDESADFSGSGGYAKEVSSDFAKRQDELFENEIGKFDIVITTAMIPGKAAPVIVKNSMISKMREGSVIVDIAVNSGGNCEATKLGEIAEKNGVKIIGYENFASRIAQDASKLYAKNISNLVTYLFKGKDQLDLEDEIVKSMVLTHNGEIYFGK